MVSIKCQMVVKSELERQGINYTSVELGEVEIIGKVSKDQLDSLGAALKLTGLELMDDKKLILIEKIKTIIIELIHNSDHLDWKEHRGIKPNISYLKMLRYLRKRAAGKLTYEEFGKKFLMIKSRSTRIIYMGYAVKQN